MVTLVPVKHKFTYDAANINVYHADKGEGLPSHEHSYSHLTICHNGSCVIRVDGKEKVIDKNSGAFNLLGGQWHEIEALEDNTVFANVFAMGKI